jgi:hypothetical protein
MTMHPSHTYDIAKERQRAERDRAYRRRVVRHVRRRGRRWG